MTSRLHASHDIASAHTKGPWSFTRYGYEKHAIADDRGTEIGFVHRTRDARLIAAAPELYEALVACADSLEAELQARYPVEAEGHSPYPTMKRRFDRDMEEVRKARSAIAKARAVQP